MQDGGLDFFFAWQAQYLVQVAKRFCKGGSTKEVPLEVIFVWQVQSPTGAVFGELGRCFERREAVVILEVSIISHGRLTLDASGCVS